MPSFESTWVAKDLLHDGNWQKSCAEGTLGTIIDCDMCAPASILNSNSFRPIARLSFTDLRTNLLRTVCVNPGQLPANTTTRNISLNDFILVSDKKALTVNGIVA